MADSPPPSARRGRPRKTTERARTLQVALEPEHFSLLERMRGQYNIGSDADMVRFLLTAMADT